MQRVIAAIEALVVRALPAATVERNAQKPDEIPAGGWVNVCDGDPGDPEIDLSPWTANYDHAIRLDVAAMPQAGQTKEDALDALLGPIGAAVTADRTLGGLCDWLEAAAPLTDNLDAEGTDAARWAELAIRAVYSTTDPLN